MLKILFIFAFFIPILFCLADDTTIESTTTEAPDFTCVNKYSNPIANGECKLAQDCTGGILTATCKDPQLSCCFSDSNPPSGQGENPLITKLKFVSIFGATPRNLVMYEWFVESIAIAGINPMNAQQLMAYLSQIAGESNNFLKFESDFLDEDSNELLGNNQTQDGVIYQGRGAILIRGRTNYVAAQASGINFGWNIIFNPERAAFPSVAFKLAAWFWSRNAYVVTSNQQSTKGSLNALADGTFHNFALLTYSLTPNLQKLRTRTVHYEEIALVLNISEPFQRGRGIECEIGETTPICLTTLSRDYCGCEGDIDAGSPCPYGYSGYNTCRNSAVIKCCIEKCSAGLDLVVIMDSSGSIGIRDYLRQKEFVKSILYQLNVGPFQTRVAIVDFNSQASLVQDFSSFTSLSTTNSIIDSLRYNSISRSSNISDALRVTNDVVLQPSNGMRVESAPGLVILISDGNSDNRVQTLSQAQRLKSRENVLIATVGIGENVNVEELRLIASDPTRYAYQIQDLDDELIRREMIKKICQLSKTTFLGQRIRSYVNRNGYKYYEIKINAAYLASQFTIELGLVEGRSEVFSSFSRQQPKSLDNFVNENLATGPDINFIDRNPPPTTTTTTPEPEPEMMNIFSRTATFETIEYKQVFQRVYYHIIKPSSMPNQVLYFSVKGLGDFNQFELFIYNETVGKNSVCKLKFDIWRNEGLIIIGYILFKKNFL